MKQLIHCLFFGLIFITSCSKSPEKVLPKKDGKWNYIETSKHYENNELTNTNNESGSMEFTKDGKLTITTDGQTNYANWRATSSTVTISENNIDIIIFDVTEKKKKSEVWTSTETFSVMGTEYKIETELKLSKK